MFSKSEIEELTSTNYINRIDKSLTIVSEIRFPEKNGTNSNETVVFLYLNVFFDNEKITTMCFNLVNYNYEEVLQVASDVKSSAFLLKEVDDYLCGDIDN